ncbi:hypothetical protein M1N18_00330 [Dehalococcoidales bacterium]|nr:hypothetical protein [Dehalococcoidales bacterium]MCL0052909.1 hypothetical protein [Dehalococcoidales bacterium]
MSEKEIKAMKLLEAWIIFGLGFFLIGLYFPRRRYRGVIKIGFIELEGTEIIIAGLLLTILGAIALLGFIPCLTGK